MRFTASSNWIVRLAMFAALLEANGCVPIFMYESVNYPTKDAALAAVQADQDAIAVRTPKSKQRVEGSAAVVIPNRQRIRERGVVKVGNATFDQVDYVAGMLSIGYKAMARGLTQADLFDSVSLYESPDPETEAPQADWIIWVNLVDANTGSWYVRKATSSTRQSIAVDLGLPRQQRVTAWVEALRLAADDMRARSTKRSPIARSEASPQAPGTQAPPPAERVAKKANRPTPVAEKAASGPVASGSAFFVSNDGSLITNYHVVNGCRRLTTSIDGQEIAVALVYADKRNDVAVLKASSTPPVVGAFAITGPRAGDPIVATGFPFRGLLASKSSTSVGSVSNLAGPGDDVRLMQLSCPIQPGNSGGPVLDQYGRVVGLIVSRLDALQVAKATGSLSENVNFGLKSSLAMIVLDAAGVAYERGDGGAVLSPADIGRVGQQITVPIDCWD